MFLYMLFRRLLGWAGPKEKAQVANWLGFAGPEMAPHWARVRAAFGTLDFADMGHSVVNIGTEWVRLDAQRAFKLGFDATLLAAFVTAVVLTS